jgi:hypothetical protein
MGSGRRAKPYRGVANRKRNATPMFLMRPYRIATGLMMACTEPVILGTPRTNSA